MKELRSRRRNQPAPPWAVFEDLCDPHRQPARPWLELRDDEVEPTVLDSRRAEYVVWSTLWSQRPDASVRFELTAVRGETDLRWIVFVEEPEPDTEFAHHMQHRIGELINANLRHTYGQ
jgi:hypothetical protein